MSVNFANIQNRYIQNFPTEVPIKLAQGFVVTAVINLVAGSSSKMALVGGALAATATLIEAVTRPIIRTIFPENPTIAQFIQILMPKAIVLTLADSAAPWLGVTYEMPAFLLSFIAWSALNHKCYERNIGMAEVL